MITADFRMFIFFGSTTDGVVDDTWWIDLAAYTCSWAPPITAGASGPPAREGHTSVLLTETEVVVFGGRSSDGTMLNDLWLLSTEVKTWQSVVTPAQQPRPVARRLHTATVIGGKMLVFGGSDAQSQALSDLWSYSSTAGWEQLQAVQPSSLRPRWDHAACVQA